MQIAQKAHYSHLKSTIHSSHLIFLSPCHVANVRNAGPVILRHAAEIPLNVLKLLLNLWLLNTVPD